MFVACAESSRNFLSQTDVSSATCFPLNSFKGPKKAQTERNSNAKPRLVSKGQVNGQPETRETHLLERQSFVRRDSQQDVPNPIANTRWATIGQKNTKLSCHVVKAERAFLKPRALSWFYINEGLRSIHSHQAQIAVSWINSSQSSFKLTGIQKPPAELGNRCQYARFPHFQ